MTNNHTATIALTNSHGLFEVDADRLHLVLLKTTNMAIPELRALVAGHAGYSSEDDIRDCTWIELCIIWLESGNHPF